MPHKSMPSVDPDKARSAAIARSVGGACFNDRDLLAMRTALNDVCAAVSPRAGSQEREFIAWLIVRLACNGTRNSHEVAKAALYVLRYPRDRPKPPSPGGKTDSEGGPCAALRVQIDA